MSSGLAKNSQTGNTANLIAFTTTDSVWVFMPANLAFSYGIFSDNYKVAFVRAFSDLETCPYIWIGGQMNESDAFMVKQYAKE